MKWAIRGSKLAHGSTQTSGEEQSFNRLKHDRHVHGVNTLECKEIRDVGEKEVQMNEHEYSVCVYLFVQAEMELVRQKETQHLAQ